ncbi:type VI secretion system membrane subunit TssM [Roseateles sp. SL47]|uniref:type VI secretion system membrane subunit TssM n=1 Tax=Roseateles sp. SL47 TaxID=2995138 RepID=UPI002270DAF6|nr:type VI secretion system membrane subunit TssM [Roseateles sp. SL47]WAC71423.1 type VI secretion system membrane subunit TssM [Roseateles sp. SL47]
MKRVLGWIFNRWVLLAVLLLAVALVLWIIGPLVAIGEHRPLESETSRWITISVIVVLVVALVAWRRWRASRSNAAVVQQLMQSPTGPQESERESADMAAVRERFQQAMATLQRARFGAGNQLKGWAARLGGRYLYELPWYLIIGAPGSGKTTALRHSGLQFPLADQMGDHAIRGVGGTRHCDWWFTDQAVLIDTAGRFTTQDSDPTNDKATWSGFLQMLRRSRPRQPLNGALVTVSVSDLLARTPAERAQYASTVRGRLQELHKDLDVRFPIYLLVTKADLLSGFMDYMATIDKDQRAAPWGFTFPRAATTPLAQAGAEFDALAQRLLDGLIDRLQAERDPQRRARIYGFPAQFGTLRQALLEFLDGVFAPSPYEAQPLLRGVYFVSGTQEGTPIDRVLGSVARNYRLENAVIAPNQASGRSYFLNRLLSEVVFAEAGLGGTNRRWERMRHAWMVAGYATVGLLGVGMITAWAVSYSNNRKYIADVSAHAEQVRELLQSTPNRASADLLPILPALDATRGLAQLDGATPWSMRWGLFQGKKLDSAAHAAYQRMLGDALLPRIMLRIEEQLRQGSNTPETLYEALKAYVMLHNTDHFDGAALKQHVQTDWETTRRELTPEQRDQLSQHLDALLAQGGVASPLPDDEALLKATRNQLSTLPLPQRIYNRLKAQRLGADFPDFTVSRAAGANASLVFVRASGASLVSGVPGLYTRDGYLRGFQPMVGQAASQLASEQSWVLGVADAPKTAASLVQANGPLENEVRQLYLTDYAATWDSFLADIKLQPMGTVTQSVERSRLLSASDSPLPPLLKAISRETTLATGGNAIEQAQQKAGDLIQKSRDKIVNAISGKTTPADAATQQRLEATIVDDRFAGLRNLVTAPPGGGKSPLDETLALIGEANVVLSAAETALKGGSAPPPSPVPNRLKVEATRMPEPLRTMLDDLSNSSSRVSQGAMRQTLSQEVRSQVGEFCQQAVAGRYPLDRNSSRDVTQADFATLFGPGGKIDQLFQQKLAPYVDTTTRPWKFRPVEGTPLGGDVGTLPQFQRAAVIKETFFPGSNAPSLKLDFKPVEMDTTIQQFILDVDGQIVRYAHGPQIPSSVQWPGPRGSSQVRVQVSPTSANGSSGMVNDGPWALFRLFDRVKIEKTNAPERFRVTFDIDGRKAVFEVTASSVNNPFRLNELNQFSCPNSL